MKSTPPPMISRYELYLCICVSRKQRWREKRKNREWLFVEEMSSGFIGNVSLIYVTEMEGEKEE